MQTNLQDPQEGFLDSVFVISHSVSTIATYRTAIAKFRVFLKSRYNFNELQLALKIKNQDLNVYSLLNEFVIYLDKQKFKGSSIRSWLAAVKGYLRHLGIKIYSEDCRHSIRTPKLVTPREEPLTKELLVRLMRNLSPKAQAAVLVSVASGMRIGEIVQLKLADIDFGSKPTRIRIRAETTKTKESRETFLTEEATNSLKDYLKRFYDWKDGEKNEHLKDQIIFGRTSLSKRKVRADNQLKRGHFLTSENLLQKMLSANIKKIPDLSRDNENGRKMIHFHAFRKYFRTVVGNICGRDYAEALIGHKFYLSTYYNLPEAQKRELYLKAEPYLTISDYSKIEQTIQDLSEKCREMEGRLAVFEKQAQNNHVPIPQSKVNQIQIS